MHTCVELVGTVVRITVFQRLFLLAKEVDVPEQAALDVVVEEKLRQDRELARHELRGGGREGASVCVCVRACVRA